MISNRWIIASAAISLAVGYFAAKHHHAPKDQTTHQETKSQSKELGNEEYRRALNELCDSYQFQTSLPTFTLAFQDIVSQWLEWDDIAAMSYVFQTDRLTRLPNKIGFSDELPTNTLPSRALTPYIFSHQPRIWEICDNRSLGLATGELLTLWIKASVERNDPFLREKFDQLGRKAAQIYHRAYINGPASNEEKSLWNAAILKRPDTETNRVLWMISAQLIKPTSPEESLAVLLDDSATESQKTYARHQLISYFSLCTERQKITEVLDAMPEALRLRTAEDLVLAGKSNPLLLTCAITIIVKTDNWKAREKTLCVALHNANGHCKNHAEQLQWALTLPERTDTEDLFRCAIRAAMYRDLPGVKKTITDLPSGWKRDNGLVALVQAHLNFRKDERDTKAIYNLIESEHFRASADQMYKNAPR